MKALDEEVSALPTSDVDAFELRMIDGRGRVDSVHMPGATARPRPDRDQARPARGNSVTKVVPLRPARAGTIPLPRDGTAARSLRQVAAAPARFTLT